MGFVGGCPYAFMYFSHTQHTRAKSSIYACVFVYWNIQYRRAFWYMQRHVLFYYIKIFHKIVFPYASHYFHFSSAHESDVNFTEFQTHVKSMNFIHLIWLFYKILHICNRSYWWYTYTCIHARMYACMCMYVRICMYMPARVYEFFGTEKPNFPFTRRWALFRAFHFHSALSNHLILRRVLYTNYID